MHGRNHPPEIADKQEVTATTNPLGLRGLGECGNPGLSGAIANAVCDAFRDLGVGITTLPVTPRRVWEAIQQARRQAAENGPSASFAPSTTDKRSR